MSASQQRKYRYVRSIFMLPVAGFLYFIYQPRLTFLRATAHLLRHTISAIILGTKAPAFDEQTPYCSSMQNYRYMLWNNAALLSAWAVMSWAIGPAVFFTCYLLSLALAGGFAIVLFTVQHNFEDSYASDNEGWDRGLAAIEGTSFLLLPAWVNWLTVDVAYHHVHHLCAKVPNYHLAACHRANAELFAGVKRIRFSEIPYALSYILWDTEARQLISVAEFEQGKVRVASLNGKG